MARYDRQTNWTDGQTLTADDLNDEFDAVQTAVNHVEAEQIADSTINGAKLADGAVTASKIADNTITPKKIQNTLGSHKNRIYESADVSISANGGTKTLTHGLVDDDGNPLSPSVVVIHVKTTDPSPWSGYNGTVWMCPTDDLRYAWDTQNIYLENKHSTDAMTVRVYAW